MGLLAVIEAQASAHIAGLEERLQEVKKAVAKEKVGTQANVVGDPGLLPYRK